MPLILLTTVMTVLVVLVGWESVQYRPAQYLAAFLIQEGLMVGAFSALDSILFYVFWEALLIPMFLVIGIWGGPRRIYATVKFFLYTFLGLGADAGGAAVPVLPGGLVRGAGPARAAVGADRAEAGVRGVPGRVRGEGADVAGAHLAAGCARGGTDRGLGDPRRDHAQARRIRLRALQPADRAGCERGAGDADDRAVAGGDRVRGVRGAGAAGHEEADCVLVGVAHGVRDSGVVRGVRAGGVRGRDGGGAGHRGRAGADDLARGSSPGRCSCAWG